MTFSCDEACAETAVEFAMIRSCSALMAMSIAVLMPNSAGARGQPTVAAISKFEDGFSSALARNDVAAVNTYIADDWQIVSGDGHLITRAAFLEVLASGDLKHDKMTSQDRTTRLYGDVALVTARALSSGSYKGVHFRTDEIATDIIIRVHGRWVCVLTQLTPVAAR